MRSDFGHRPCQVFADVLLYILRDRLCVSDRLQVTESELVSVCRPVVYWIAVQHLDSQSRAHFVDTIPELVQLIFRKSGKKTVKVPRSTVRVELRHDKKLDLAPVFLVLISDKLREVPVILFKVGTIIFLWVESPRKEEVPLVTDSKLEYPCFRPRDIDIELFSIDTADVFLVRFNSRIPNAAHPRELDKLAIVDRQKALSVLVFCLFERRTITPDLCSFVQQNSPFSLPFPVK